MHGVPDSSQFSQSVSSVQSVSWFGEASRGEPGYPDFHGTLKVKKDDDWTCPLPPIKKALNRSDAADRNGAHRTTVFRRLPNAIHFLFQLNFN